MSAPLKAPLPYFGGKSRIASQVWARFGDVRNYVEPFFGSGAMLLARPQPCTGTETVNDANGMLANFWRALQADPDGVAHHANWPVNENDLHARHIWLVEQKDSLQERLEGDPEYHDAKIAGWWVWGTACWIGSGFCSGIGPWRRIVKDGYAVLTKDGAGRGVHRQRVHLGDAGRGVHRKRVHLGNAGQGVHRQRVHLGNAGQGVHRNHGGLLQYMQQLADRLRHVRVCCGDWSRVCGPAPTTQQGLTAVFLDPPYADTANRNDGLYAHDSLSVAHAVREWAIANGDNPKMRIALCGYEGEHTTPDSWGCLAWKATGGMANTAHKGRDGTGNHNKERIWFSPHCIAAETNEPLLIA